MHCRLQDTPGLIYGQTNVRIPDHITKQNADYLAFERDPQRRVPMSASDDHRVDACLFFLNPNHMKDAEVEAMAHLSELVPVVPMIAKVSPATLPPVRLYVHQLLHSTSAVPSYGCILSIAVRSASNVSRLLRASLPTA